VGKLNKSGSEELIIRLPLSEIVAVPEQEFVDFFGHTPLPEFEKDYSMRIIARELLEEAGFTPVSHMPHCRPGFVPREGTSFGISFFRLRLAKEQAAVRIDLAEAVLSIGKNTRDKSIPSLSAILKTVLSLENVRARCREKLDPFSTLPKLQSVRMR